MTTEIAIHEAGHAIMFDALGVPMELVTIAAGCDGEETSFEGCVKLKKNGNPVCDVIPGTLAGPGASFFIAGVSPGRDAIERYGSDQKVLIRIHQDQKNMGTSDDFWLRLQQFLAGWMKSWLVSHKDIILRFAERLQAAGTLQGKELRQALDSAWVSSKPDVQKLRREAAEALSQALGSIEFMKVYRLVNCDHDPIVVGARLRRPSDHSHQKLGEGIYFSVSRDDALQFASTNHKHKYTHLLTCRLRNITKDDFVDLVNDPNRIVKAKAEPRSKLKSFSGKKLYVAYCREQGKKGLIWSAQDGWTEVCLLSENIDDAVDIEHVEALNRSDTANTSGSAEL